MAKNKRIETNDIMDGSTRNGNRNPNTRDLRGRKPGNSNRNNESDANRSRGTDARGTSNYCIRGQRDLSLPRSNDPKWWNKNAIDYSMSTMLQWDKTLGIPLKVHADEVWAAPQILRVDYIPGPGLAQTSADGVNKALEILMTQMYAATTGGNLDFERADIGLLMTGMASIAAMIGAAKRALAFSSNWITRNTAYPKRVLQSMGFSYSEITTDRPALISLLNEEIRRFNSIKFPALVDYFDRSYMLASNIFCDEDSPLAQLYYWMPKGYYLYEDTKSQNTWKEYSPAVLTSESESAPMQMRLYIEQIRDALDAWFNTDDLRNINGAFQRCFGTETAYFIPEATLNDSVTPHTDEYLAQQLMNMNMVVYSKIDPVSLNITQDPYHNLLKYQPRSAYAVDEADRITRGSHILRTFKDKPSADDNMEMTRFIIDGSSWSDVSIAGDAQTAWYLTSFGTELITNIQVVWSDGIGENYTCQFVDIHANEYNFTTGNITPAQLEIMSLLLAFRYTPQFVIKYKTTVNDVAVTRTALLGDLCNYTLLSPSQISDLNRAAILSIWKLTRE